jgi:transketolase
MDIRPRLTPTNMRNLILTHSKGANVGHIGSCLSIVELLVALYTRILRRDEHNRPRDQFILSKGHAALALYAALHLDGCLSAEELSTYCRGMTLLGVHPTDRLKGVEFSSGSLGQGLAMGVGAALAARLSGDDTRIYVLLSDAECQEGSVWESAMFASHHRLSNLFALIDFNGQQAMGATRTIIDQSRMEDRWRSMGWDTVRCDGHDTGSIGAALTASPGGRLPRVLIADTVGGKGVSYMEGQVKWHYWPMSEEEFAVALNEQRTSNEKNRH